MNWRDRCPYLVEASIVATMMLVIAIVIMTV